MSPHISFDTGELTLAQAHTLVDAAYGVGSDSAAQEELPDPTRDELEQAARLDSLSTSPAWRAVIGALTETGEVSMPVVASRAGVTPRGVLVAIGRAVQGDYESFDWTWTGSGSEQTVSLTPGLWAALRRRAAEDDIFGLDDVEDEEADQ